MLSHKVRGLIRNILNPALRRLRNQHGGVAMIFALSAPLLIAATGFAVDIGYWYQEQESLQSAADAAALAAANAQITFSTVTTRSAALPFAQLAGNNATNNQFNFNGSSSSATLTVTPASVTVNSASATQWVATVTAPRGSFFSRVHGLGLTGLLPGTQGTSATADYVAASSSPCLLTTGTSGTGISSTGGSVIKATGCSIFSNSNSTTAVTTGSSGSGVIEGSSVGAVGTVTIGSSNGYIGPTKTTIPYGTSAGNSNSSSETDPYASVDSADTSSSSNLPWQKYSYSTQSAPWTNAIGTTGFPANTSAFVNYTAPTAAPGAWKGMSNLNNAYNTLNYGTAAGTSWITGGIGGTDGTLTTLNGNTYYIAGGFSTNCWGSSPGLSITASYVNMYNSGAYAFNNTCAYLGLNFSTGGVYIFNGGAEIQGSTTTAANFASGTYVFTGYTGVTTGGFYGNQGTDTFGNTTITSPPAPATYFFDNGLYFGNGTGTVTLEPGIYYIRNGTLSIGNSTKITGTGVTFVLEGTASLSFSGGTNSSLSAPDPNSTTAPTNCVLAANFPENTSPTDYSNNAPYDGTNGKGICGVLVYQDRADTTGDTITEGAGTIMNGIIYAPSASLTVNGSGSISSNSSDLGLAIVAKSVNVSGGGTITLASPGVGINGSSSSNSGSSSSIALLVQ
jgi:Flp pilus assembly protein TadG